MKAAVQAPVVGKASPRGQDEAVFVVLAGVFVGLLTVANIIAAKPVQVGPVVVPAAVLAYALTFLVTDIISEIWGRERAQMTVWSGFFASLVGAALIRLAVVVPAAPFYPQAEAFSAVLGANLRIVAASMVAYLISQSHDVWAFHFWRARTRGRHLWLRNNASTLVSQGVDTTLFITLAFYGVWPDIGGAIVGQFGVKALIALADTPFMYGAVYLLRRLGVVPAESPGTPGQAALYAGGGMEA